ncbi:MAG: sigma-54-dependent Fis family transcriptional regulator [Bradymonadales bacterium]|nr:sigma-54-dependent Fis family transcriptional regulator [Bradymonadales bacterium]
MILICDDEKNIRRTLRMVLEGEGYPVQLATNAEEALALCTQGHVDLLLLDVMLPGMSGLDLLRRLKEIDSGLEVIMISGHATLQDAMEATRLGAYDFLEKPIDRERLLITLRNCLERKELRTRVKDLLADREDSIGIIGDSPVMKQLLTDVDKVAPTKARILITGESGSGKELVARAIHRLSPRSEGPFIKVNCAAIPADLIESELFGHEKGAFTGAIRSRRGRFQLADKGTILLDEIADMSPSTQAKVLRVLQTAEITPVGSERSERVDVRVIASTNKELKEEIAIGRFREDLYFRLAVVPLRVPPLREHPEDIPLMVTTFLDLFAQEHDLAPKEISPEVLESLTCYRWPGNVRELKNVIERLLIMGHNPIQVSDLPDYIVPDLPLRKQGLLLPPGSLPLRTFKEQAEKTYIEATLRANDWNVSRTADQLGVERTNLHKKLKQLGIEREPS